VTAIGVNASWACRMRSQVRQCGCVAKS